MLINANGDLIGAPFLIDGVLHPDNIESRWGDDDLAAVGLFRAPVPAPEPVAPPPLVASRRQFMLALHAAGLLEQADAFALAHAYPPVRILWANASEFDRSDALLLAMATELGNTEEELDAVFYAAVTL